MKVAPTLSVEVSWLTICLGIGLGPVWRITACFRDGVEVPIVREDALEK
jgi:hypothetical protein